jgi:hypothetical protein
MTLRIGNIVHLITNDCKNLFVKLEVLNGRYFSAKMIACDLPFHGSIYIAFFDNPSCVDVHWSNPEKYRLAYIQSLVDSEDISEMTINLESFLLKPLVQIVIGFFTGSLEQKRSQFRDDV